MSTYKKSFISQACPEVELLLCCARTEISPEQEARINALLREPLDWDYLLDMAFRHALVPLLYSQLKRVGSQLVPPLHLNRLREEFVRNSVRNILLTRELGDILEIFDAHALPAIPYKGPVLATTAYGDIALRQFSDLDILVRERDAERAAQLLLSAGYRSHYQTSRKALAYYVDLLCEQGFVRSDSDIYVEIHWAIAPKYVAANLDSEVYFGRAAKTTIGERSALTFTPEDLLLALCIHAGKHQWERLAWVCDLNETINRHSDIRWAQLLEESQRTRTRRMLYLGLHLTHDLLGTYLPAAVLEKVQADSSVQALGEKLRRRFFEQARRPNGMAESMAFHFKVRERALDGARCCYYLIIPPTPAEVTSISLPNALSFLYYLLRPLRLINKHAHARLRRLTGFFIRLGIP
jgi:hypothetical protein